MRTLIFCRIKVRTVTRQKSLPLIKPHSFSIGNPAFSHASVPSAKTELLYIPRLQPLRFRKYGPAKQRSNQQPIVHGPLGVDHPKRCNGRELA
jgi:hypothetical protein